MMPTRPWKADKSRIYDARGREIAVVTKATNEFRASVEEIAAAIVEAVNASDADEERAYHEGGDCDCGV